MNSKFYVSLKAARLLKEKGYNEETIYYYNSADKLYLGNGHFNYNAYAVNLSAPTKSEAIDWLESKGITIEVHRYRYDDCDNNKVYRYYILEAHIVDEPFSTRLEAEDAAIIKACELL